MHNLYVPHLMTIEDVTEEAPDVKTFHLVFKDEKMRENFEFETGQFGEYSAFGHGECTFCIASASSRKGFIQCTFRKSGKVTDALYNLEIGDTIGFRGPYGNTFDLETMKGKNLVFVAGGIGLPPLRSLILTVLDNREDYGDITIVYGARTVKDLVYKEALKHWADRKDIKMITAVDPGGETDDWDGKVGFVPTVLEETAPSAENTMAVVCGPPIMIKFSLQSLEKLGFSKSDVITTLENRMKCGFGKCGRCNVGNIYVCKDGPVFTAEEVAAMPNDF